MTPPRRNYSSYAFRFTLVLILALVGLSFVPPFEWNGIRFKRADIVSDIVERNDEEIGGDLYFDTTFLADYQAALDAEAVTAADTIAETAPVPVSQDWDVSAGTAAAQGADMNAAPQTAPPVNPVEGDEVRIQDYGRDDSALSHFYDALTAGVSGRPIKIAVLGDSFIEGDIFTADLRELLQDSYGGNGVGFVPFASPLAMVRRTATLTSSNWQVSNVVNRADAPDDVTNKFFISGALCRPSEGAYTKIKGEPFRKHLTAASTAKLLFINEGNATLHITVNDSLRQQYTPPSGSHVQQYVVRGAIGSIAVRVTDPEGFYGYGILFEGNNGIAVDNYSIRGNSGLALFGTSRSINSQIHKLGRYDLVILQYGLNVMSAGVNNYSSYAASLVKVINYIKLCFPGSSVLVMGVGDRGTLRDGQVVTMPAVHGLLRAQQEAAEEAGVAFWNTFLAMGGENSIARYASYSWAAKDYTHISYQGGKQIACEMVKAIQKGLYDYENHAMETAAEAAERERQEQLDALLHYPDSMMRRQYVTPGDSIGRDSVFRETGDTVPVPQF